MSLLLSWETPAELWDLRRSASSAQLSRLLPGTLPEQPWQVVGSGIAWGFYEDTNNDDPTATYRVRYTYGDSAPLTLEDCDIRRWRRPDDSCRVDFAFRRPDSAPWGGRRLKLFDMPGMGWIRDIWCDFEGKAHIVLLYGQRCRLEIEGEMNALEFVVPRRRHIEDWMSLSTYGTLVRVDQRSIR
jgi:hypothetical protein